MKVIPLDTMVKILSEGPCKKGSETKVVYRTSSKVLKNTKRKVMLSKVCFQFDFKSLYTVEDVVASTTKLLNQVSRDNLNEVVAEARAFSNVGPEQVKEVSNRIFSKCVAEPAYCSLYLELVELTSPAWESSLYDCFLRKLQESFEKIEDFSKEKGCAVMVVVAHVFTRGWLQPVVFQRILRRLCAGPSESVEHAISFLKSCAYTEKDLVKKRLAERQDIPRRVRFLIEAL